MRQALRGALRRVPRRWRPVARAMTAWALLLLVERIARQLLASSLLVASLLAPNPDTQWLALGAAGGFVCLRLLTFLLMPGFIAARAVAAATSAGARRAGQKCADGRMRQDAGICDRAEPGPSG